eukprot:CAMPEP_0114556524 /NCGR_PEP_ID=MMETSP0114-20121206/9336_1 /TAXON_ID=31324 /ORGANISM="Goniomonas sp, Strain m" /LENGTH=224 /DNA_ID=CAMNT_0001741737 /DNA_START=14 /DNA_END=688 /DNA_ORIENTATION=-
MAKAQARLAKELKEMTTSPPANTGANTVGDNLFKWEAFIIGPDGTPFEGGRFELAIEIPHQYPIKPPHVVFKTKVYHPNVSQHGGDICVDILKGQWSPALKLSNVLVSLLSLLNDPNADDPLEPDVAKMYKKNRSKYEKTAREWTQLYATPKSSKRAADSEAASDDSKRAKPAAAAVAAPAAAAAVAPAAAASTPAGPPPCQYGAGCYRKNPQHLKDFSHPGRD